MNMQKTFRFISDKFKQSLVLLSIISCLQAPSQAANYQSQNLNFPKALTTPELTRQNIPATSTQKQGNRKTSFSRQASSGAGNSASQQNIANNDQIIKGRTYNHFKGARVVPPKRKAYPILDQLEFLLFPNLDFHKEQPGKRLERLELAVFGNKQKGKITTRVTNLQNEVDSWQIANMQAVDSLAKPESLRNDKPNKNLAYAAAPAATNNNLSRRLAQTRVRAQQNRLAPNPYQAAYNPYAMQRTMPYQQAYQARPPVYNNRSTNNNAGLNRTLSPFINRLGYKTLDAIFD